MTMSANIHYKSPSIEEFYREHRTRWDQFYESERVMFERVGIGPTASVLDLGCGCGGLGLALRERFGVHQYVGVEINPQAAESAAALNPAARFLCADILTLDPRELEEESFDLVVSLSCIDWNVEFARMLTKSYSYVKPGGCFLASFRLTDGESQLDAQRSYQYINFEGKREGEIAPYVVLNARDLLHTLKSLVPARICGFGYWGPSSATAVTPVNRIGFAVIAVEKAARPHQHVSIELELPPDLLRVAAGA
jgi:SAM-dependent methyltransferase